MSSSSALYRNQFTGGVMFRTIDVANDSVFVHTDLFDVSCYKICRPGSLLLVLESFGLERITRRVRYLHEEGERIGEPDNDDLIMSSRRLLSINGFAGMDIRYRKEVHSDRIIDEYESTGKVAGFKVVIDNDFTKFAWVSHFDLDFFEKLG